MQGELSMKKQLSLRMRKTIFLLFLAVNFLCILIFNILTPYMSDELLQLDLTYSSFWDMVKAEWHNYQTWNGRFIVQLIMRCFIAGPKWLFNICNSLCFLCLILLMYFNIDERKSYDFVMLGLTSLFVWLYSVNFGQTILWLSGACNYLWGSAIILSMITLYRYKCKNTATVKHPVVLAVVLFFLGVASGWCNENTSGGGLLLVLYTYISYRKAHKKKEKPRIWMLTGILGMLVGLAFMVLAPGNRVRSALVGESETHTGVMRYLARFLQINVCVEKYLFVMLCIIVIILAYKLFRRTGWKEINVPVVFAVCSIATSYALIMTVTPMDRAYFGADVFMMIAALQSIALLREEDGILYSLKYAGAVILAIQFFFVYCEDGADLMRIKLFLNERDAYVAEQKAMGNMDLTVMCVNPAFDNDYTFIMKNDVTQDPESWGCAIYREYYGLNSLVGTPFEENVIP